MQLTPAERKRYVLKTKKDLEILEKIKKAERIPGLTKNEKSMLSFLRTQLEKDWRTHILKVLSRMIKRKRLQ